MIMCVAHLEICWFQLKMNFNLLNEKTMKTRDAFEYIYKNIKPVKINIIKCLFSYINRRVNRFFRLFFRRLNCQYTNFEHNSIVMIEEKVHTIHIDENVCIYKLHVINKVCLLLNGKWRSKRKKDEGKKMNAKENRTVQLSRAEAHLL